MRPKTHASDQEAVRVRALRQLAMQLCCSLPQTQEDAEYVLREMQALEAGYLHDEMPAAGSSPIGNVLNFKKQTC